MDSFRTLEALESCGKSYRYHSLRKLAAETFQDLSYAPVSLKILLENALRHEDGDTVTREAIAAFANGIVNDGPALEIPFYPARIVMHDTSGIPIVPDIAAMRDAMVRLGGNPGDIDLTLPTDLVIDHSVMIDIHGHHNALARNMDIEYRRNAERYSILRWAEKTLNGLRIIPPGNGITHQVNLEFLGQVVCRQDGMVFPETLLGADSHTPMINALGILGWGSGGLEVTAALLGEPINLRTPPVVGVYLTGRPRPGVRAMDIALTLTETLRKKGVVRNFVEYFGPGLANLTLTNRATCANMAPEYGATTGFFPVDQRTLDYLVVTGRDDDVVELVERYTKAQGLWHDPTGPQPIYSDVIEVNLSKIGTSVAGPSRPHDRRQLSDVPEVVESHLRDHLNTDPDRSVPIPGSDDVLRPGDIVLAAITSCTNTSNTEGILAAGLLARNAVNRGLKVKPWLKASIAPGSRVTAEHLTNAGLQQYLDELGFYVSGFGCTTCMGNSGPLPENITAAISENGLKVAAAISGNRNFEGRIHPLVSMAFLATPHLVLAYAIAGSFRVDLDNDPLGQDLDGNDVFLADILPEHEELDALVAAARDPLPYRRQYGSIGTNDSRWSKLAMPEGAVFSWSDRSNYLIRPPFLDEMPATPEPVREISGARPLLIVGDTVTTDHISPIGAISPDQDAGQFLQSQGVDPTEFNSFGSRRSNHHVMMRGAFSNPHLRNEMLPGTHGGVTVHMPSGRRMSIFEAAMRYAKEGTPLVVIGGWAYGMGSSRDWAAKGTWLLGVRAVIAENFERIHRDNLIAMGVLPLQFTEGQNRISLGLNGTETFDVDIRQDFLAPQTLTNCVINRADGGKDTIELLSQLDTWQEVTYFSHGGILPFIVRSKLAASA